MKLRVILPVAVFSLIFSYIGQPNALSADGKDRDLLVSLKKWTRPGKGANPWLLTSDGRLINKGTADLIMLEEALSDGTIEFEWRFAFDDPKKAKNVEAYFAFRSLPGNGGAKVALGNEAGRLAVTYTGTSDALKEATVPVAKDYSSKLGEWNKIQIEVKGSNAIVKINGQEATSSSRVENLEGAIAFETKGAPIEIRRLTYRGK